MTATARVKGSVDAPHRSWGICCKPLGEIRYLNQANVYAILTPFSRIAISLGRGDVARAVSSVILPYS